MERCLRFGRNCDSAGRGPRIGYVRAPDPGDFDADRPLDYPRVSQITQGGRGAEQNTLGTDTDALFTGIGDAHAQHSKVEKAFKSVATFKKEVPLKYPYDGASKSFEGGRFYYIDTVHHVAAAFCSGKTMAFYDPNVGVADGVKKKMIEGYFKEVTEETIRLGGADVSTAKKPILTIRVFKPL